MSMCSPISRLSRREDLLAAEREELLGQGARSLAGLGDLAQLVLEPVPLVEVLERAGRVAVDDEQEVVEIVGDPAGQATDRFHLLRLEELIVRLAQFQGTLFYRLLEGLVGRLERLLGTLALVVLLLESMVEARDPVLVPGG